MGINLADRRMVAAWKAFAEEHPKRWAEYDGACNCAICTEYRRDFHVWFEERKAAQSEIAMEMESHNLTPQQARQMALDHLHRAEAGREACRAKEAHECTCGTLDAVRLEAADELDRLTATPCIPWRHCSEHGDTFEDGESMMVAVPVRDDRTGKSHWDIECIVANVDDSDDTCTLESLYGDDWGWDWASVEWWLPMSEVIGTLPAVEAAEAAERGE